MTAAVVRADARDLPLPDASVDLIITSPPYFGLRSYTDGGEHYAGQIGSEGTPREWLANLVECTREWVRVLKPSGSIFVNLGDKYSSGNGGDSHLTELGQRLGTGGGQKSDASKLRQKPVKGMPPKSLLGLPWRYAIACMDELGLILRRDIVWAKPNGLPESVTDRCRSSHEYLFHLVRQPRYYAAVDEIREPHSPDAAARARSGWKNGSAAWDARVNSNLRATDGYEINPLGKLPGSVWSIPSQPLTVPAHLGVDHFAAFPLELPRRCILGWSPPGVCTVCGEGRRPVAVRASMRRHNNGHHGPTGLAPDNTHGLNHSTLDIVPDYRITGYACACTPDVSRPGTHALRNVEESSGPGRLPPTTPALVLDPFAGTGTTMLAASALGRVGIGCDLSMDYARLARWRTRDRGEIAKAMQVPKPPPVVDGQEALFT